MRFKILGPLDIADDHGGRVTVSRRLHRAMLAFLLLNAGQPSSPGDLIIALWGDEPPLRPDVSLRSCVYGVRKALPDPGRLRTHPSGYLIQVEPGELDLQDFRDLAGEGRDALDCGDPRRAAARLTRALSLWREPPLADLPATGEKDRLLDHRRAAQDALMDAWLALGRHRQVLAELRSIVADDPLREHAWAQLMLALYRCGARAEALAAFSKLRMALVSAYGIEPGPELQDLHAQVLADEPALLPGPGSGQAAGVAGAASWQPPCQLPAAAPDFTGRTAELAATRARLSCQAMPVTVVSGMPGAGKTALAVHAAHLARPGFPDGQLFACLDDAGRARDPHVVLGELLRGLGVRSADIPAGRFEREALYRTVLAGRRVLVLADGARSAGQVRPLLPGTAGSAVVVTSRARLADLDGARLLELGGLDPADSVALLAAVAGRPVRDADARAAMAIADACGHLPLALRIAGARLADEPGLAVTGLAGRLADEGRRLAELAVGGASVRARLAEAARSAGGPGQRALALLAAAGDRDLSGPVIAALLRDPRERGAVAALADAGLLSRVAGSGRDGPAYRMHPLVRSFAGQSLARPGPELAGPDLAGPATGRLPAQGWPERVRRGAAAKVTRRKARDPEPA